MSCKNCEKWSEEKRIHAPYVYLDLLEKLRNALQNKELIIVKGTCSIEEILSSSCCPDDILEHEFSCPECGAKFNLYVNTYKGSGGWWNPVEKA